MISYSWAGPRVGGKQISLSLPEFPGVTLLSSCCLMLIPRVFISSRCTAPLPGVHLVMSTPLIRCVWPCAWPDSVETRACGVCCCCQHGLVIICPQLTAPSGRGLSSLRSELAGGRHSPSSSGHATSAWALWGWLQGGKTALGM